MNPVLQNNISKASHGHKNTNLLGNEIVDPYEQIDFSKVQIKAQRLADVIDSKLEALVDILLTYESYEVAEDEIARTLDLLKSLKENQKYFQLSINEVTVFLPRNQPLYAFACFVIVPSLMSSKVHFRIPHSMHHFFPGLMELLEIDLHFPNVCVSKLTRLEFLRERSAVKTDPKSKSTLPVTDAVIFTGTSARAEILRMIFDKRTMFISNGSGHNPLIVSNDADIEKAVDAVLTLQLYNQGQDCAAPNAILVHRAIAALFLTKLRIGLSSVKVGKYTDRACRVGPISDPKDLVRVQDFFVRYQEYLDNSTNGVIRTRDGIVEPTIIRQPLKEGGNYTEIFAPVIFFQEYDTDNDLASYFENSNYVQNAMYLTVYGTSNYVSKKLISKKFDSLVVHNKKSVLWNTHLHVRGQERGTEPYGGYGPGASSITIGGKTVSKPTLPQRDIYEQLVKPLLRGDRLSVRRKINAICTEITQKNVEKLLRIAAVETKLQIGNGTSNAAFVDILKLDSKKQRYVEVAEEDLYRLVDRVNAPYVSTLAPTDTANLCKLLPLLAKRSSLTLEEFTTELYALPKVIQDTNAENKSNQRIFFKHVYQVLFAKDSGPRLSQFLFEVKLEKIVPLLDL